MNWEPIIQKLEAEISRLTQAVNLLREYHGEIPRKRVSVKRRKEIAYCGTHPKFRLSRNGICLRCRQTAANRKSRRKYASGRPAGRPRKETLECMDCRGPRAHHKFGNKAELDQHRKIEHGYVNGRPVPEIEDATI